MKRLRESSFDQKQKEYFEMVAYDQFNWLTNNPQIALLEQELLSELLISKPEKILELGCAEGADLVNLRKFGIKCKFYGLDYSKTRISFAKKNAPFAEYINADAYDIPFKSSSFDVVFCKNLLHHLSNYQQVVNEMIRVCRPGGRIVLIEPNGKNPIFFLFSCLVSSERGLIKFTSGNIVRLIKENPSLRSIKVLMKEPDNLLRLILHYRWGSPGLSNHLWFWPKIRLIAYRLLPKQYYGYMFIEATKGI
ncbi:MAG: methyltransferase domain-containing protein [Candidatus Gottesmanbacteria bacterium]